MRWFKHFTDNHRGRSVQDLMDQLGHTGLCYYLIMEMCAEKLEQLPDRSLTTADCAFGFRARIMRQMLRISPTNLVRLLDVCAANGLFSYEIADDEVIIEMPILLDLLDYDQRRDRAHSAKTRNKNRIEKRRIEKNREEKNREEESSISVEESPKELPQHLHQFPELLFFNEIKEIKDEMFHAWVESYPLEYLHQEFKKAKLWCIANPKKKPKQPSTFLTNWLSRGWESYRKSIPSEKTKTEFSDLSHIFGEEKGVLIK